MLHFIFISGTGESYLTSLISQNENCPVCHAENTLQLNFFQKYYRLYYIPTFPLKKTGNILCTNCSHKAYIRDCSPQIKAEFDLYKPELKKPIWTWTGTILIISLIGLLMYSLYISP